VEPPQTAQRRKGETIQGFTGCVQSLHEKLHECGLVLPALAIKLKIVSGICGGPYHDVFTEVYHRMCVLNDSSWQLDAITQATLVKRLTGILHASDHWGHGKLQPGEYPKDTKGNPSARSAQPDEAPGDATCDWRGQAELNWSQAFSILQTYKCPVCRSIKHSLVDCPVAQSEDSRSPTAPVKTLAPTIALHLAKASVALHLAATLPAKGALKRLLAPHQLRLPRRLLSHRKVHRPTNSTRWSASR
jgi:hypothetical protein